MKKRPNYDGPLIYKGDNEGCFLCGGEKLEWHDAMLCVLCDNRDDTKGTWFVHFAEAEGA